MLVEKFQILKTRVWILISSLASSVSTIGVVMHLATFSVTAYATSLFIVHLHCVNLCCGSALRAFVDTWHWCFRCSQHTITGCRTV